jgi:hypothetical protein
LPSVTDADCCSVASTDRFSGGRMALDRAAAEAV